MSRFGISGRFRTEERGILDSDYIRNK
jgi:hypothetical protein